MAGHNMSHAPANLWLLLKQLCTELEAAGADRPAQCVDKQSCTALDVVFALFVSYLLEEFRSVRRRDALWRGASP